MEFFTTLKDTPVPTLLVIGGFIFLFLGIATIKKPIVIDVTPSSRKIALILGIILVGAGLYLLSQPPSESTENLPTETPTISVINVTETPSTIGATTTETPAPLVVYSQPEIIHLGDESVSGWAKVTDVCLSAKIQVTLPVQEVILSLETFGLTERAIIKVNDNEISVIPPLGASNQDIWSENRSFPLLTNYFVNGYNILEICAVPLTKNSSYPGEKDDFQIRNVLVTTR
jgi:hypothetical protein